jgi:hypothetical protein
MLAPFTVTMREPVAARFFHLIKLKEATSNDHPCVTLPPRSPTVIVTRRVPRAPCVTRHLTDVSDSHSVASHPVCPSRARPVYVTSPMLAPCTVTDADPVPARFCPRITLKPPTSTDHPCVTLPPRSPTVIVTRRVPRAPCVTRHLTDVSDSHSVASHPVCPSRARPVYVTSPMLAPCTVTCDDPVPARFCRRITLKAPTSTDHPCVTLPAFSPSVMIILREPAMPWFIKHEIDV